MTERVNLVDAYDNRSVIAKMVNMEERISGAETSVKASAEAAASSASAAAASQTAARTSENNAEAAAASAAAALADTVDLSSKQTVTGAKTFAGDTTVTGSFVTSGNAEMASLDIDTGTLTVGSGGTVEINGALAASNAANVITAKNLTVGPDGTIVIDGNVTLNIKSGSITLASGTSLKSTDASVSIKGTGNYYQGASHNSVLVTADILTAKDINETNGKANNLVHRNGDEPVGGIKTFEYCPFLYSGGSKSTAWNEVFRLDGLSSVLKTITCIVNINGAAPTCGLIRFGASTTSLAACVGGVSADIFCATLNADGTASLWINASRFNVIALDVVLANRGQNLSNSDYSVGTLGLADKPAVGDDYTKVTNGNSMW